jgi:thioredoxin
MKTICKTAISAIAALLMFAACGNAGAKTADRKDKETKTKGVVELDADAFMKKVYDMSGEELVYLGDKPAIVDFTASWCGPCQRIAPILEELAAEYKGKIVIYKVDIDKERGLAEAFNVSSIPAVLYIPTGADEPIMTIGARGKEKFVEEINKFLIQK